MTVCLIIIVAVSYSFLYFFLFRFRVPCVPTITRMLLYACCAVLVAVYAGPLSSLVSPCLLVFHLGGHAQLAHDSYSLQVSHVLEFAVVLHHKVSNEGLRSVLALGKIMIQRRHELTETPAVRLFASVNVSQKLVQVIARMKKMGKPTVLAVAVVAARAVRQSARGRFADRLLLTGTGFLLGAHGNLLESKLWMSERERIGNGSRPSLLSCGNLRMQRGLGPELRLNARQNKEIMALTTNSKRNNQTVLWLPLSLCLMVGRSMTMINPLATIPTIKIQERRFETWMRRKENRICSTYLVNRKSSQSAAILYENKLIYELYQAVEKTARQCR
jgi:hypothetical protein